MKKTELKIFEDISKKYDSKNKTNKSPEKEFEKDILQKIEKGITLEFLEEISEKRKVKIFKYKTQITIHGVFPDFGALETFGYKNIIQNQNKSIGVKWNTIDEEKRRKIAEKFWVFGFRYSQNSLESRFTISKIFDSETRAEKLRELKEIFDSIDTSLFFGKKEILEIRSPLCWEFVFVLKIDAIPEENIQKFFSFAKIEEKIQEYKEREARREEERRKREEKEKEEREKKFQEICQNLSKNYQIMPENETLGVGQYFFVDSYDFANYGNFYFLEIRESGKKKEIAMRKTESDFERIEFPKYDFEKMKYERKPNEKKKYFKI